MQEKLENYLDKIVKKFEGKYTSEYERELKIKLLLDKELELDKIEYPPSHYQKTDDLLENARLYKEALEKIRQKYRPHLLDTRYLYGDELIHMEIKRESYCRRFNLTPEDLEYVIKEVKQRINDEARLAEINFRIRDDNCAVYELEEALELEKKYGSKERVAELGKMLEKARAKWEKINRDRIIKISHRNNAKWSITLGVMSDLKYNVNPRGGEETRPKYQINWKKKLDLLKKRLKEKGIYLNEKYEADQKHEAVIKQTWEEVNEEIRKEQDKKLGIKECDLPPFDHDKFNAELLRRYPDPRRMNFSTEKFNKIRRDFYQRQVEEYETNNPRGLEEYARDSQKLANRTVERRTSERSDFGAR
ncbi:MAG: hypothetical protein ACOX2N_08375 [Peptococcia bacterium]|jgi:hypothetical protein